MADYWNENRGNRGYTGRNDRGGRMRTSRDYEPDNARFFGDYDRGRDNQRFDQSRKSQGSNTRNDRWTYNDSDSFGDRYTSNNNMMSDRYTGNNNMMSDRYTRSNNMMGGDYSGSSNMMKDRFSSGTNMNERNFGRMNDRSNENRMSHSGRGPKGWQRSDERIHEEVCERLAMDHDVDASEIEVSVKDGVVNLKGRTDSRKSKRAAEDLIEDISGVKDVRNEISVDQSFFEQAKEMLTGKSSDTSKSRH